MAENDSDQKPKNEENKSDAPGKSDALRKQIEEMVKREWVRKQHDIHIKGHHLAYTSTVGVMPVHNEETHELEAGIFFTAYTLDGVKESDQRPLMFVFNGGPGSASVWLHLGAV